MTNEQKINDLSEEELKLALSELGLTPSSNEKFNQHSFLTNVVYAEDTTRLGYLDIEELGKLQLTQRACKELASISENLMNNKFFKDYFLAKSEILTSTSLSKNAKLIDLAVVQRREVTAKTNKPRRINKGWFGKREEVAEQ